MARSEPPDLPSLFDLPLEPSAPSPPKDGGQEAVKAGGEAREARQSQAQPPPSARLTRPAPPREVRAEGVPPPSTPPGPPPPAPIPSSATQLELEADPLLDSPVASPGIGRAAPREGTVGERVMAGLADLALHGAVAVILLAAAALLEVAPTRSTLGPLLLFLAVFSFFYCAVALAFWGATPGMAWRGLVARGSGGGVGLGGGAALGEPLTFAQASRRWLGALVTVLLLGLPLLPLTWGRRTLSDRLSGSFTLRQGL